VHGAARASDPHGSRPPPAGCRAAHAGRRGAHAGGSPHAPV